TEVTEGRRWHIPVVGYRFCVFRRFSSNFLLIWQKTYDMPIIHVKTLPRHRTRQISTVTGTVTSTVNTIFSVVIVPKRLYQRPPNTNNPTSSHLHFTPPTNLHTTPLSLPPLPSNPSNPLPLPSGSSSRRSLSIDAMQHCA